MNPNDKSADELAAAVEIVNGISKDLVNVTGEEREALTTVLAALASAQGDGKRLDWLQDNWGYKIREVGTHYTKQEFDNSRAGLGVTASFREAIDTAMSKEQAS